MDHSAYPKNTKANDIYIYIYHKLLSFLRDCTKERVNANEKCMRKMHDQTLSTACRSLFNFT